MRTELLPHHAMMLCNADEVFPDDVPLPPAIEANLRAVAEQYTDAAWRAAVERIKAESKRENQR